MKIPNSIKIGGKTISIKQVAMIDRLDDKDGFVSYSKQEIHLVNKGVHRELMEQSFVHEVLHFILYELEMDEFNKDRHVQPVSELLFQVLKQL